MAKLTQPPRRNWIKKTLLIVAYAVPLVALATFGGVYFKKYQDLRSKSADQLAQSQVDDTLSQVAKLYDLPKEEKPVVATVKDKEAYKKQYPNFGSAENNDVLIIYTKAQLAILYRPSEKRLIKVGPVNIDSQSQTITVSVIGKPTDRQAVVKTLAEKQVTVTEGAEPKGQYTSTIVVDVSGKNADQAKAIATAVGGQVAELPAGEDKPTTDLLIIAVTPTTP